MTATGALLVHHRSVTPNYIKPTTQQFLKRHRRQINPIPPRRYCSIIHMDNLAMSKTLIHELDLKMQQVKEYGLLTHGYRNENFQYPVHVRRSHDGEKVPHSLPIIDKHHRLNRLTNTTILTSSSYENQTSLLKKKNSSKKKQTFEDQHEQTHRIFVPPPNKTINDIDPSLDRDHLYTTGKSVTRFYNHRKSSSSSTNSSPTLCSLRPHSIACLSTAESIKTESTESTKIDEPQLNLLSNSSQSLINHTTSRTAIRTITQRFFSKFFHNPSKT